MDKTENKFRSYILGILSDVEAEKMDLRIISGEVTGHELSEAEDDLIEDFLDGFLTVDESIRFEKNFLISQERLERLEQIESLRKYSAKMSEARILSVQDTSEKSRVLIFLNALGKIRRPIVAAFASVIVLVAGFLMWNFVFRSASLETAELNAEIIKLNERDFNNLDEFRNVTNLSLIYGNTRSANSVNSVRTEDLSESILLRLAVPTDLSDENNFKVKVFANGQAVFSLDEISPYKNQSGSDIRFLLPQSSLTKGGYRIVAFPKNDENYQLSYSFQVK